MKVFGDLFSDSTKPQMVKFFNIYDDWLEGISSDEAVARLVIILRALSKDEDSDKVKKIVSWRVGRDSNKLRLAVAKVEAELAFHLSVLRTAYHRWEVQHPFFFLKTLKKKVQKPTIQTW